MQDFEQKFVEKYRNEKSTKFYVPKRYVFTLLSSFALFNAFSLRANLSVAIVAMVNQTAISQFNLNSSSHQEAECPNLIQDEPQKYTSEVFKGNQYNWDSNTQGKILGSFFYGYVITQLPGGILSEKFGVKWLFGGGILVASFFTLFTPLAASWGPSAVVAARILEGLGEGVTFPAINFAISKWSPKFERSRISTLIYLGCPLGTVFSMSVSGWLCSTDILGGWPSVFYVFGGLGCIWFIFWCCLMYEKPSKHPNISKEELLCIEQNKDQEFQITKHSIPWTSIFTSVPVWALIFTYIGSDFGYFVLLTKMPTYLGTVLHFDIGTNGVLSALPFVLKTIAGLLASILADKLRENDIMSITNIRKMCSSISLFGPALCLIGVPLAGCNPELVVALLSLSMALNGFKFSGYNISPVDMSPDHSGTLYSIVNTVASLCGFLSPMVVGVFTESGVTIKNWSYVFYLASAIYIISGIIFAAFSSAELQPWGVNKEDTKKIDPFEKEIIYLSETI